MKALQLLYIDLESKMYTKKPIQFTHNGKNYTGYRLNGFIQINLNK